MILSIGTYVDVTIVKLYSKAERTRKCSLKPGDQQLPAGAGPRSSQLWSAQLLQREVKQLL